MTISFDFDDTLTKPECLGIAIELMRQGHKVYILTARKTDLGDVIQFGSDNGFSKVIFSQTGNKWAMMEKYEIDVHVDDAQYEVDLCIKNKFIALNTNPIQTLSHRINKEVLRIQNV